MSGVGLGTEERDRESEDPSGLGRVVDVLSDEIGVNLAVLFGPIAWHELVIGDRP